MMPRPLTGSPSPNVAGRLEQLSDEMRDLRDRLKASIASAIGTAVAEAVRDAVSGLLGVKPMPPSRPSALASSGHGQDRYWDQPQDDWWSQDEWDRPQPSQPPLVQERAPNQRWREAVGAALKASLWWLRDQKGRRPVLTTSLVALAAGVTALVAGPAVGGSVGVLASVVSLVLTADAATSAADRLAGLASG
jgi:hypothetical protein